MCLSSVKITKTLIDLDEIKDSRIRILKFGQDKFELKSFHFLQEKSTKLLAILPASYELHHPYALFGEGSKQAGIEILAPPSFFGSIGEFVDQTANALINDQLHIFGGFFGPRKIARLDECQFFQLKTILKNDFSAGSAAISTDGGSRGRIISEQLRYWLNFLSYNL